MAYLIDALRTPFGKHKGGLAGVRTDDLAAAPLIELIKRYPGIEVDDVVLGNANGAGEDNRNVARMAALLAGLPLSVPGATVNRLCASGAEAVMQASRAIDTGDASLILAGGVESMTRAPFVLPKPDVPFPAEAKLWNTQLGWRMVNPKFSPEWPVPLGAAAEKVALEKGIGRQAQDEWSLRSHQLASKAPREGIFAFEGVEADECIRPDTSMEKLAKLKP